MVCKIVVLAKNLSKHGTTSGLRLKFRRQLSPGTFQEELQRLIEAALSPRLLSAALRTPLTHLNEREPTPHQPICPYADDTLFSASREPDPQSQIAEELHQTDLLVTQLSGDHRALRALRKKLVGRLHPDVVPAGLKPTADELLKKINASIDKSKSKL